MNYIMHILAYRDWLAMTAKQRAFHMASKFSKTERNPKGWREVDGVQLPLITWSDDA